MNDSLENYRIELDCYNGPLDLLLYLVKRHEIDLYDLPIAKLTDQYLEHLKLIEYVDVDLAGEFLIMAATLLEIKSQLLLPPAEQEDATNPDAANNADPRFELIQQLLAYKRFKDAANDLDQRRESWEKRFAAKPSKAALKAGEQANAEQQEFDLDDVNILDLCKAFSRLLESIGQGDASHKIVYDDTPIALHAEDIVDRLKRDGKMSLQQIFKGRSSRSELIGLFMATLELVRQKRLLIIQDAANQVINLELTTSDQQLQPDDDDQHDWRDPETGEIQYDWPDEKARKRAARRDRLRRKRAGLPVEDLENDKDKKQASSQVDNSASDLEDEFDENDFSEEAFDENEEDFMNFDR